MKKQNLILGLLTLLVSTSAIAYDHANCIVAYPDNLDPSYQKALQKTGLTIYPQSSVQKNQLPVQLKYKYEATTAAGPSERGIFAVLEWKRRYCVTITDELDGPKAISCETTRWITSGAESNSAITSAHKNLESCVIKK